MRRTLWMVARLASLIALAACGSDARTEGVSTGAATSSVEPESPDPVSPQDAPEETAAPSVPTGDPPAAGTYEVHEWGLIAMRLGHPNFRTDEIAQHDRASQREAHLGLGTFPSNGNAAGTIGLGRIGTHGHGGKPVLYIHLPEDGPDEVAFRARVGVRGGDVAEHFPAGVRTGGDAAGSITWESVVARREGCRGTYPEVGSPACETADEYCERAELPEYETEEAACLRVGEVEAPLLFYRGDEGTIHPPLTLRRTAEQIVISRHGSPGLSGEFALVARGRTRTETRVLFGTIPADGERVALPILHPGRVSDGSVGASEEVLARLLAPLTEAGLSEQEAAAFRRAWDDNLFGSRPSDEPGSGANADDAAEGAPAGHPLHAAAFTLLYWLPRDVIDTALPLEFTPPPRELRRMILARVDLAPPQSNFGPSGLGLTGTGRGPGGARGGLGTIGHGVGLPAPAEIGRVRLGELRVRGRLPETIARRILRRHLSEVRHCLEQGPSHPGRLTLRAIVSADGRVTTSTVAASELRNARADACAARAMRRWQFPAHPADEGISAINIVYIAEPAR